MTGAEPQDTALHSAGMNQLILHRGGLDSLGLGGLVKGAIQMQNFFWLFATPASTGIADPSQLVVPSPALESALQYPTQPTSRDLKAKLSNFPPALRELSLYGNMNYVLIDLLASFQVWLNNAATRPSVQHDFRLADQMHRAYDALRSVLHPVESSRSESLVPECTSASPCNRFSIESAICLVLVILVAEFFYGSPLRDVAPPLAMRLEELTETRLQLQEDYSATADQEGADRRVLERKCISWALMLSAEACDGEDDGYCLSSRNLMARVFKMETHEDEHDGEVAWNHFHRETLEQFLCPWFLVKDWKRCWMKYWNAMAKR